MTKKNTTSKSKTRKEQLPDFQGKVAFTPQNVDRENRTVEICFTTGQAGMRYDWWNDISYEESLRVDIASIRADRLDKGLSVIDSHRTHGGIDAVLGVTEGWRIENGELVGECRFSKNQQEVFDDIADGILRHASLGYRVYEYAVTQKVGETEKREAVDWEPTEISIVPVSFETTNGVREAERSNVKTHACKLTLIGDEKMVKKVQRDGDQGAIEPVENQERVQGAQPAVTETVVEAVDEDAVRAETRGELNPLIEAARAAGKGVEVAVEAYSRGISIDKFREELLADMAKSRSGQSVNSVAGDVTLNSDERQDRSESVNRGMEMALTARTRLRSEMSTEDKGLAREFSGLTGFEMARDILEASGISTRGLSRQKVAARAMHSTSDFPLILENVMNKSLMAGYEETPRTFQGLGHKTTVNDFREKHMYTLGDAPSLLPLGEHGEYESGTFGEAKEKYSISTFARKISFTRKMLINDDMSAIDKSPRFFGAAGSRLESDIVWGLLLNYDFIKNKAAAHTMEDGKPLFHADHKNLATGAASELSKDSLTAMRKSGRKAKTLDNHFMNLMYSSLVVPEDLETLVEELLFNNYVATKMEDTNSFRNKFETRIEPRLAAVSATAWYAFSNMVDTFEYASLAGEEEMYTEVETSTDIDGLEIKVRKDFGAGIVDYRGMYKAVGA